MNRTTIQCPTHGASPAFCSKCHKEEINHLEREIDVLNRLRKNNRESKKRQRLNPEYREREREYDRRRGNVRPTRKLSPPKEGG